MALLNDSTRLPPDILSYLQQSRNRTPPSVSIRTLRFFANRLPTSLLSTTAHLFINLFGDVVAGNNNLRQEYQDEKWRQRRIERLRRDMDHATSLAEYESCTTELDILEGHESWKACRESVEPAYNPAVIQEHLQDLQLAAKEGELASMAHLLRTSLSRDLGGMNMLRLYKHSWFGTKHLIDDYINTAVATVDRFLEVAALRNISTTEAGQYQSSLEDALKYFGRSALTLSGGASLGMKHIGVVKALWEAELLPAIISGASAGSIVAAVVGSSTDEEMLEVLEHFPHSDLAVFDGPQTSMFGWAKARVSTMVRTGAFFEISNLQRVMKSWLKDLTFREAHYKTGRIVNICVSSIESSEARLLNYVTAPDVYIWSAVCASCSVPLVFQPATIYEKDPITKEQKVWMQSSQQQFVDGSLDHDIPMRKLSEMFNVNFFLVSQVNPHVRVFLEPEEEFTGLQPTTKFPKAGLARGAVKLARDEIIHRAQLAADLGAPRILYRGASVLNQQYTGDINILPEINPREYLTMMANPSPQFMLQAMVMGEKATWPKMCRIKNSVAIELALMKAIHELRDRANFSPEARAARQAARGSSRGRSRSMRGRKPNFLRRRSLSNDYSGVTITLSAADGPPSPMPMRHIRRNASAGSLLEKLERMSFREEPKGLAPQAGLADDASNHKPEESLMMTMRIPRGEEPPSTTLFMNKIERLLNAELPLENDPAKTTEEIADQEIWM